MKTTPLLLFFVLSLYSCGPSTSIEEVNQIEIEDLTQELTESFSKRAVKDTQHSKKTKNNKFEHDFSDASIDKKATQAIEGSWYLTSTETMIFLQTHFDLKDTVVFDNSSTIVGTGWGEMKYNTSAEFYLTENSSHLYEYYISKDEHLYLTQFDYFNDDLSYKEKPDLIAEDYSIKISDKDNFVLFNDWQKFLFKRTRAPHKG